MFNKEKDSAGENFGFSPPPSQSSRSISIAKPSKFNFGFFLILATAIAAGGAAAFFYLQVGQEKEQRLALEAAQIQIEDKAASYEQSLKQKEKDSASLRDKLQKAESQIAGLTAELQSLRSESQNLISQLQGQLEALQPKAAENVVENAADAGTTDELDQPLEPEAIEEETLTAKVLSLNEKFNFVVINWGSKDDLKLGAGVKFVREGKVVGEATVEKLYDNFAAATITSQPSDEPIREGDLAVKA